MNMETQGHKTIATVCMCKNEEQTIGRMIRSASVVSDKFIFTDTGSEDKTIQVIRQVCEEVNIPCEIFETTFKDFGTTRTEAIGNAKDKADYLLLLDADMTIEVDDGFDRSSLDKDGYHVRYTGSLDYAQMLFVSGKLDWKYHGVTHEYLHSEQMKTVGEVQGLKINHYHDGGCRSDKFERDIRLLKEGIKQEPKNRRYYFYLAQTYKDQGQSELALKYYQDRIDMGGWQEEVYYSMYQKARMLHKLERHDEARIAYLDAWEYRPRRLESLYGFAVLCRQLNKHNQAIAILEKALQQGYPQEDVLFVEKPIYEFLLKFEYSISLFYVGRVEESVDLNNELLKQELPDQFREQVLKNKELVLNSLKKKKARDKGNPEYNKKVLYVSAFTEGSGYEKEVKRLRDSFEKFGVDYIIYKMDHQGSWERNTQEKVKYIFKALNDYKCPIVWVDADAELLKKDDYFHHVQDDIQVYEIKEWEDILTGTMFLNYNQRVIDFLGQWVFNNEINSVSCQKTFIKIYRGDNTLVKGELPCRFIKIYDNELQKCDDPVIVHYQGSRRYKRHQKRVNDIKQLFSDKRSQYNTCAVVGNGPFENDLSQEIDNSFAIRCNNFKIGAKYQEIGSKTDVNISSLYHKIIPQGKVDYSIIGVHPISSVIGKYSDAKGMYIYWNKSKHQLVSQGNDCYVYNEGDLFFDHWRKVADAIDGFPTTGLIGIALARYWGFKKIILTGFDFFTGDKTHYFTDKNIQPSAHHKVNYEAKLLKTWMEYDDIEYVLDERTRKSLDDVKPIRFKHVLATRFNLGLYDSDSKDVSGESIKKNAAKWMNDRLKRFRDYTIPSVRKQNQTGLDWVVFFDPDTPQSFRKRIEALRKHYNFTPVYNPLDDYSDNSIGVYKLLKGYIHSKYKRDDYDVIITTRIDNDDGLIGDVFSDVIDRIPVNLDREKPLGLNLKRGIIGDGSEFYEMNYPDSNFVSVYESYETPELNTVYYTQHGTEHIHRQVDIRYFDDRLSFVIYTHGSNLANDVDEAKKFGQIVQPLTKTQVNELHGKS